MISFNSTSISQQSNTGILLTQHITLQAAAEVTGYNIQYLRRLLRSGGLKGVKIGQMWLIEMDAHTGSNLLFVCRLLAIQPRTNQTFSTP